MDKLKNKSIIVFDGVCNLCNGAVNFIIQHDRDAVFIFVPLQSACGQRLSEKHGIKTDSIQLIKNNKVYAESDAVLEILKDLSGIWPVCRFFKWIPKKIRDGLYRVIAKNRYKIFGKKDVCMVPDPEILKRFRLEQKDCQ